MRLRLAAAALAATFSLSACAYGGYPGVSVGYGNYGSYGSGYYDPYAGGYSPYGYSNVGYGGYGSQYGWYDGYYYPGSGYYVYDQYRRPRVWNDRQRQYWVRIKPQAGRVATNSVRTTAVAAHNWTGFNRPRQVSTTTTTTTTRADRRAQVRATAKNDREQRRRTRNQ